MAMAKEQKRGNREAKKPKMVKKDAPAAPVLMAKGVLPAGFPKKKS
jgi:hypothetical protein